MSTIERPVPDSALPPPIPGQPAWGIALLFPLQGSWTEADYLALDAGRHVEYSDGCVEVLELPTKEHRRIVRFLFQVFAAFASTRSLGEVFFAPFPVRLWPEKFREPDVVFLRSGRPECDRFADGADLVIEVVSQGEASRQRDYCVKRAEYSRAGIPEYWLVDPFEETVTVFSGVGAEYSAVRVFQRGDVAGSVTLEGLSVPVNDLFNAGKGPSVG